MINTQIERTEKQVKRGLRNKQIANDFLRLKESNPDVKNERIFVTLASNFDLTPIAIRGICKKMGVC